MQMIKGAALFTICAICCVSGVASANFPITSVVLYPGSATIERSTQVTAATRQVEVKDLPANFDIQTLRVQADPGIQVGQVVTQDASQVDAASAREAEIETKIQALQDKEAALEVDAKSAELVQHYLEKLSGTGGVATDKAQPYIDAKSMAAMIDTIRHSATDSFDRIQKVDVQKRGIEASIAALQSDLQRVRGGTKTVRSITVNLVALQAGTVHLSYQVNGAGWKPGYRAALDSVTSKLELERLATVSQKTGEDWNGVRLKLSTGQPRLSPQAPEPLPWLLTYHAPVPVAQYSRRAYAPTAAPAPMMASPVLAYGGIIEEKPVAYEPPVVETENTFTTEFDVPSRVTLPADGRDVSVSLSKQSMPVKQMVRVVPRVDKNAVVLAEAERPAGVWLSGGVQLYRDGSYVGATQWNAQTSDALVFPFGRDDLIRVTVDRAKEQSGSTGLLSQKAERHVGDIYTLTSFHKTPIDLVVLEASPTSTSEEVKVQPVFQPKPTIDNWEQRQGVVGWNKTIAPNETMKISVDYQIAYPKEGSVSGLP
ncbi:MAG TPA: DUF4139 domain-containing protein [Burkholderiaceae bacterium]|jgi:uncharacterized protein (TIGR02231 family)|nr:DUF4139 domain-containing protein [Burkholderiaceae bacterium]